MNLTPEQIANLCCQKAAQAAHAVVIQTEEWAVRDAIAAQRVLLHREGMALGLIETFA